jgi:polysaccharide export outer membrane protein
VIQVSTKEAAMKFRGIVSVISVCAVLAINALAEDPKGAKPGTNNVASSEYRLGAEDVIFCFVYKEPELTTTVVIRPDGMITVPMAGLIQAAGKTTTELEAEITARLLKTHADPVVNVSVTEINSPKISVLGQVNKADVFPIRQRMTVLDAISRAGGFTEFAKRDRVIVIRQESSGQKHIKLNLRKLSNDSEPFYLQATDVVLVE